MKSANLLKIPKEFVNFSKHLQNSIAETILFSPRYEHAHIYESKFAGFPYLPIDSPYPKDETGKPMLFLAQLNFSQFQMGEPFPDHGILQFYLTQQCYNNLKNGCTYPQYKIRYYASVIEDLSLLTTDFSALQQLDYEHFPIAEEVALKFTKVVEPVSATDYRLTQYFNPLILNEAISVDGRSFIDLYLEHFLSAEHKIGGYPYFIHEDVRHNSILLQRYDTLLFQIVSNDEQGIMWGDSGVINFFINSKKLRELDFSDIFFHAAEY